MSEIVNPYIAGAPITETSMFFGRADVFGWINRSLTGKYVNHILVIHGQRRVGKTSILKQIPNFLSNRYIQVFFDLQGRTNTTFDRLVWWLGAEITRTLNQKIHLEMPKPEIGKFQEDPDYLLNELLPDLLLKLEGRILLLTFDEFDSLDRPDIAETLARPLISYLRRIMDLEGINFIFSIGSSGNKLENMKSTYTDFFKTALYRKISFLTKEDCQRLVNQPVEGIIKYEQEAVEQIFTITSGHPYFIQLICHELFSICQKTGQRLISGVDVSSVLDDVIERGTVNLKFVWDEASDLEKWILAGLAHLGGGVPTRKLSRLLADNKVRFSEPDLISGVIHLRDKDVINEDNRFIVILMLKWIQRNRPLERVHEELEEVNPIANRYIEIGDEYKEQGKSDLALQSYRQALQAFPDFITAHLRIGELSLAGKNYSGALVAFESAYQIDPDEITATLGICRASMGLGDLALINHDDDQAVVYFERVLQINPEHNEAKARLSIAYRQLAEKKFGLGEDKEGLLLLNRALRLTPGDLELGARYQEMQSKYKQGIISNLVRKAEAAIKQNSWEKAVKLVEEAVKIDPDDQNLKEKLANIQESARQYRLQDYSKQVQKALDERKWDKAIDIFEQASILDPEDEVLKRRLADLREKKHQEYQRQMNLNIESAIQNSTWQAAENHLEEYRNQFPQDSELVNGLWSRLNKYKQLEGEYSQGQLAIRQKDFRKAITIFKGIIAHDPEYKQVSRLLAEAVESSRQEKHAMPSPRLFLGFVVIVLVIIGGFYLSKILPQMPVVTSNTPAEEMVMNGTEAVSTVTSVMSITPQLAAEVYIESPELTLAKDITAPILQGLQTRKPDFEEDFSTKNEYWATMETFDNQHFELDQLVKGNVLHLEGYGIKKYYFDFGEITGQKGNNYVFTYDFRYDIDDGGTVIMNGFYGSDIHLLSSIDIQNGLEVTRVVSSTGKLINSLGGNQDIQISSNRWHNLQYIIFDENMTIFMDNRPVYFGEKIMQPDECGIEFLVTSNNGMKIEIDNIKFWNLDENQDQIEQAAQELIKKILPQIRDTADFREDFNNQKGYWADSPSFNGDDFVPNQLIDKGVLTFRVENSSLEKNYSYNGIEQVFGKARKNLFLSYYFRFYEGYEGFLNTAFMWPETNRSVNLVLKNDVFFVRTTDDLGIFDTSDLFANNSIKFQKNTWHNLKIIAFYNQLAVYVDSTPIAFVENIDLPDNIRIQIKPGTDSTLKLDLDNIIFWNLEGINAAEEFARPILNWSGRTEPDFIDDFSVKKEYWSSVETFNGKRLEFDQLIQKEVLHLDAFVSDDQNAFGIDFLPALDKNLNNFILQYDFKYYAEDSVTTIHNGFLNGEFPQIHTALNVESGLNIYKMDTFTGNLIASLDQNKGLIIDREQWHTLQLVVHSGCMAVYLDGVPVSYLESVDLPENGVEINIGIDTQVRMKLDLDNIKIWNLDALTFSQRQAAKVLAEVILTKTGARLPDFETFFLPAVPNWSDNAYMVDQTLVDLVSGGRKEYEKKSGFFLHS